MYGSGHGGPSKNRKRRVGGKDFADKGLRRRAARFHRHLPVEYYMASSPGRPPPASPATWSLPLRCGVFVVLFLEGPPWPLSGLFQRAKLLRLIGGLGLMGAVDEVVSQFNYEWLSSALVVSFSFIP